MADIKIEWTEEVGLKEEFVVMLRRHFTEERYTLLDLRCLAQDWVQTGISVEEAEKWVQLGYRYAHSAVKFCQMGLTPEQTGKEITLTIKATVGRWLDSRMVRQEDIMRRLKELESPRLLRVQPAVCIIERS